MYHLPGGAVDERAGPASLVLTRSSGGTVPMRTRPSASFVKFCASGNGSGTEVRARRIYCPTGIAEESPKWYAGARNPSEELDRVTSLAGRDTV